MVAEEVIPITLEFVGTVLIGIAVLRVHTKVSREHKIDKKVLKSISRERTWTIAGLALIAAGYILNFI
jgi:hypothetical protein